MLCQFQPHRKRRFNLHCPKYLGIIYIWWLLGLDYQYMYIHKSHSTGWGHNQHHTSHNLNDPLLTLINKVLNINICFGTEEAFRLLNSLKHLKLSAFCIRHLDCSSMWIDNKWTLVHVMIRRPLVNSHYLRQWWPSSLTHMCVIRHQPSKMAIYTVAANTHHIL